MIEETLSETMKFIKNSFTLKGRINQKSFIVNSLILNVPISLLGIFLNILGQEIFPALQLIFTCLSAPLFFLGAAGSFCLSYTRLADTKLAKYRPLAILAVLPWTGYLVMAVFAALATNAESTGTENIELKVDNTLTDKRPVNKEQLIVLLKNIYVLEGKRTQKNYFINILNP